MFRCLQVFRFPTTLLLQVSERCCFIVFLTKFKGSCFSRLIISLLSAVYRAVAPLSSADGSGNKELLPYACLGVWYVPVFFYLILAGIIKLVGINKVMRLLSPGVIMWDLLLRGIGLGLCSVRLFQLLNNWWLAIVALGLVIIFNIFG